VATDASPVADCCRLPERCSARLRLPRRLGQVFAEAGGGLAIYQSSMASVEESGRFPSEVLTVCPETRGPDYRTPRSGLVSWLPRSPRSSIWAGRLLRTSSTLGQSNPARFIRRRSRRFLCSHRLSLMLLLTAASAQPLVFRVTPTGESLLSLLGDWRIFRLRLRPELKPT
jgi:hypothetical protein